MSATIRFDEALKIATDWAMGEASTARGLVLVRDLLGRFRVVPQSERAPSRGAIEELHGRLGAFSPGVDSLVSRSDLTDDESIQARIPIAEGVWLIDRLVSEQDWSAPPVARAARPDRIVFYGLKGGVGRSTALSAVALQLASRGFGNAAAGQKRKVLVVDLDLESPGSTTLLLGEDSLPRFGVLDGLVEDAVEQADAALVREMVAESRLGEGNLWVAPAFGAATIPSSLLGSDTPTDAQRLEAFVRDGAFVSKLGRAYASPRGERLAARLERLLEKLEDEIRPDVVLLDSRAGLHDISAALVPRLGATRVLLFAGAGAQTWLGYRMLFASFRRRPDVVRRFRDSFQVVASLVPETERKGYLEKLRTRSYEAFAEFLYDRVEAAVSPSESGGPEPFSFDLDHEDAPHYPIPVYWRRELVEWDPTERGGETLTHEQFDAAFADLVRSVEGRLGEEPTS